MPPKVLHHNIPLTRKKKVEPHANLIPRSYDLIGQHQELAYPAKLV